MIPVSSCDIMFASGFQQRLVDQAEPIFFASDYRAACVRKLGECVICESIPVFGHFLRYMIYI